MLYALVVVASLAALWHGVRGDMAALQWVLRLSFLWWIAAFLWIVVAPASHTRFTAAAGGILILVPAGIALAHLYGQALGPQWVLFLLSGAAFAPAVLDGVRLHDRRVRPGAPRSGRTCPAGR